MTETRQELESTAQQVTCTGSELASKQYASEAVEWLYHDRIVQEMPPRLVFDFGMDTARLKTQDLP